jgi:hypothetical protein
MLADMLTAERNRAVAVVEEHESRLKAEVEFPELTEPARSRVLASSVGARTDIQAARFVSGVRDRLTRYTTREYPAQLTLLAQVASQEAASRRRDRGEDVPMPAPIQYTPAASLRPACSFSYVANVDQLDQWLEALRAVAKDELAKGHRISL